jgi:hypothetical protein
VPSFATWCGASILLLASSCAPSPPANTGDPGNARLHYLERTSLFFRTPPSSTVIHRPSLSPATWSYLGGWSAPEVATSFTSSLSVGEILLFYGNLAADHGYRPVYGLDPQTQLPYAWTKRTESGFQVTFMIAYIGTLSEEVNDARNEVLNTIYVFSALVDPIPA